MTKCNWMIFVYNFVIVTTPFNLIIFFSKAKIKNCSLFAGWFWWSTTTKKLWVRIWWVSGNCGDHVFWQRVRTYCWGLRQSFPLRVLDWKNCLRQLMVWFLIDELKHMNTSFITRNKTFWLYVQMYYDLWNKSLHITS